MNYPAASSGVSQKTETFGAASGGESMGCGIAAGAASDPSVQAEGIVLITPSLGQKLYAALGNEKRLWMLRDAGHDDWIDRTGTACWREVLTFLVKNEKLEGPGT
jgi:hypothetical protein